MTKKKKTLLLVGAVAASPILLFFILAVLLYIPPIQNWAVRQIAAYASEKTGYQVGVDRVRLSFPLDLDVKGLEILCANDTLPQVKDSVVAARDLYVRVRLMPLLHSQVEIDNLDFRDVRLNTVNLIASARVRGRVGRFTLTSHGIDLRRDHLVVNDALLSDARVSVLMNDSVPEDTTQSTTDWRINVEKLRVSDTHVVLHMPGDTLRVSAILGDVAVRDGLFDLGRKDYRLSSFAWKQGALTYDNNFTVRQKGFDYNHIALSDLTLRIDSFAYANDSLCLALRQCVFKEKCGLTLSGADGTVFLDTTRIRVPVLNLRTPESHLRLGVSFDFNALAEKNPGHLSVDANGSLGKQDLVRFMGGLPSDFSRRWPNYPLAVKGVVRGNMRHAQLVGLTIALPTAFTFSAEGFAAHLDDMKRMTVEARVTAHGHNLDFLSALLPSSVSRQVRIPRGITLAASLKKHDDHVSTTFSLREGSGSLSGKAGLTLSRMAYEAELNANAFHLQHFLPSVPVTPLSGAIVAKGVGTDFLSSKTSLTARAGVSHFGYANYNLSGTQLTASLKNGRGQVLLDCHSPLLDGVIDLSALMNRSLLSATVACDLKQADLYSLHLTKNPMTVSLRTHIDVASDYRSNHRLKATISDVALTDSVRSYHPEDIHIDAFTRRDSTHAAVSSGDFRLLLDAQGYYERLLKNGQLLMAELDKQRQERFINQKRLRALLPKASLVVETGKSNMICRALSHFGYDLAMANIVMNTSPQEGINGLIAVDSLCTSGIQLDTLRLSLRSDSTNTFFEGQIRNNKNNPQYVFNAQFGGTFFERGIYFGTRVYDANDKLGVALGLSASMKDDGIELSLGKKNPVLGYKEFAVNDDNYILLGRDQRVSANLSLLAKDGMGVQVYTNDSTEALQDITIGLTRFDLEKVLSVIPYVPHISGTMNGDFHVIQTDDELSVSSSVSIDKMVYEGCPMGDISTEFVYMPKAGGSHYVDGTLSCNDYEVCTLKGTYKSEGSGELDADLTLAHTPLLLVNGFIPDQLFGLKGYADGTLSVVGSLQRPNVNGEIYLDSAYISSDPYGVEMRFANDPVTISNSHLIFENFEMFSHNDSPLNVSGYFDFSDMDHMYLDTRMQATNYLLIDSKENRRSETYGKAYVNFYGMMRGPVESLSLRGKLDVLGSTDMTYILRDSPLTTDNQLDELVQFVNFKDTKEQAVTRPPLTGLNVDLSISIDEGAHVLCALNTDHSNYIDLIGGGDLRMQYNATDNLQIRGRYTLSNGEMKYSLPVIPLKTFTIQDGSYVEFTGDPMNPRLNITATEQNKANVTTGGNGRTVLFECGVVITKTLSDMGLQFIIDAPEDMSIHNELQTMSVENRGKLAVTMLTTGMYLTSGNTNSFSMNSALSAFLNSQINAISGNALRTLDLSFGMDNTMDGSGQTHTDYSFKFAKRFWNNRLRIVVGGKVSSGADTQSQNETFFDNVTFEYRLSQNSNKYLKLFYDRDSYDWLEGNVEEYGGGFIWRRKLQHFKDIFRFKSEKETLLPAPGQKDSVTVSK